MISIVSVYNNPEVLQRRLLNSLESQNTRCEVVTIDNRDGAFANAATALNHGAERTSGEWTVFVHQDVAFLSRDWLASADEMLTATSPSGWVGAAGRDARGTMKGFMLDRARLLGHPFDALEEVQTLDECLLVHRQLPRGQKYFDEAVPGWHAYGVDACCDALRAGQKNHVMSWPIWHDSASTNLPGLDEAHEYVWQKHKSWFPSIHTSVGTLPDLYRHTENGPSVPDRIQQHVRRLIKRLYDLDEPEHVWFDDVLESLTNDEDTIECLHRRASAESITASAFVPQPARSRVIHHRFSGLQAKDLDADCVVIAPHLARVVSDEAHVIAEMAPRHKRLIVCVHLDQLWRQPVAWRNVLRLAGARYLTTRWGDGARIVILQCGDA